MGTDNIQYAMEKAQQLGKELCASPEKIVVDNARGSIVLYDKARAAFLSAEAVAAATITPPPAPRLYKALTLASLVALTTSLRGVLKPEPTVEFEEDKGVTYGKLVNPGRCKCFVFVSLDKVQVLLDEGTRQDRVVLDLVTSPAWKTLRMLDAGADEEGEDFGTFNQKEIVAFLKTGIDAAIEPSDIVSVLSKVKFSVGTQGEATTDSGKYAASKSVQAEITGTRDLPDVITFDTALWLNVLVGGELVERTIAVALDANAADCAFTLRPYAGALDTAEQDALGVLADYLRTQLKGVAEVFEATL